MISSSHLKATYSLDMPHHSSETVFGFIDCISLHIKKNLHLNLSRLMQNITIFINNWQIENITTLIKKYEVADHGAVSAYSNTSKKIDCICGQKIGDRISQPQNAERV